MTHHQVSILDFGAAADTGTLQTEYIQKAIDYCFTQGGGEVTIPAGRFLTGDIRIRSHITLHLLRDAVLLGSQNPEDYFHHRHDQIEPLSPADIADVPYVNWKEVKDDTTYIPDHPQFRYRRIPSTRWSNAILRAFDAHDFAVIGDEGSVIDGQNCFDDVNSEEKYRGPHGMTFFRCRGITLKGYTIQNTGNWAHNICYSQNISVQNITALAGHDGFDMFNCRNIAVENCTFHTGDDCVAGYNNINVLVRHCLLNSSCSALRFGGSNVLVEHCRMVGPGRYGFRGAMTYEEKKVGAPSPVDGGRNNMLSAFTYYADFGYLIDRVPENILIQDCTFENADRFLHYNFSGNETWQKQMPMGQIAFRRIRAVGVSMPLTAYGHPDRKVDLELSDVDIQMREGAEEVSLLHLCHYNAVRLHRVKVKNNRSSALIRIWSDGELDLREVEHGAALDIAAADTPFTCKSI